MSQKQHRYFRNDAPLARRDPYKQLVASLTRLVTEHPPDKIPHGGGLYYGPTSVAHLFATLQEHYPTLEIEGFPMSTWAAAYLEYSQSHIKDYKGPTPDRCGVSDDIMSLLALYAANAKDEDTVKELCEYAPIAAEPGASMEWLYGGAGYLYLLRLVRKSFRDNDRMLDLLDDAADAVIDTIMDAPRPWKWHGKAYVGAVHGAVGILTQIVLTDPTWAPKLEADLLALLSYQYEGGNWPSSIPPGRDKLVQFCHGAPGVVASLDQIKGYFPAQKDKIESAIKRGRECILERGLLTKEPCLCHGISGNALALADRECEHFLTYTTGREIKALEKDGVLEKSEDPSALWCGEAGRAWAWAVVDKKLPKTYLGYNDI